MLDSSDSEQADVSVPFAHEHEQRGDSPVESHAGEEYENDEDEAGPLRPKNDNASKIFRNFKGLNRPFRISIQDAPQCKRNLTLKVSKLKNLILDHGGEISGTVARADVAVFHPDESPAEIAWFCRRAVTTIRRIDVVHHSWVQACIDAGEIVDSQDPRYDCYTLCKIDREAPSSVKGPATIQAQSHAPTNGISRIPYTDEDRAFIISTLLDEPTMHPQGNIFAELLNKRNPRHSASSYQNYVAKNLSNLQLSAQMERISREGASKDLVEAPPPPPPAASDDDPQIQQAAKEAITALTGGALAQPASPSNGQIPLRKWNPSTESRASLALHQPLTMVSASANPMPREEPSNPLRNSSLISRTKPSSGVSSFYPQQQATVAGMSAPAVLIAPAALSTPGPSPPTTPTLEDKLNKQQPDREPSPSSSQSADTAPLPTIYQQAVAMGSRAAKRFERLHFQGMSQVMVPESDSDDPDPSQNQSEEESQLRSSSPLDSEVKQEDQGKDKDVLSQGSDRSDAMQSQDVGNEGEVTAAGPGQTVAPQTPAPADQMPPGTSSIAPVILVENISDKAPTTPSQREPVQANRGSKSLSALEEDGGPSQDEQPEVTSSQRASSPAETQPPQANEAPSVEEEDEIEDEEMQEDEDDDATGTPQPRRRDSRHLFVGNSQYPVPEEDPEEEEDEAETAQALALDTRQTAASKSVIRHAEAPATQATAATIGSTQARTQAVEEKDVEKGPNDPERQHTANWTNFASVQLASLDRHEKAAPRPAAVEGAAEGTRKRARDLNAESDMNNEPVDKRRMTEEDRSRTHLLTSTPPTEAHRSPTMTHDTRSNGISLSVGESSKRKADHFERRAPPDSSTRHQNDNFAQRRGPDKPVHSTSLAISSAHRVPSSFMDTARQLAAQSRRISAYNASADRVSNTMISADQSADTSSSAHWHRRANLLRKMADWSQIVGDFGFRTLEQINPYMTGRDDNPQSTRAAIESHYHEIARHYEIEVDMVAKTVLDCGGDVKEALKVLDEEQAVLDRRKRRWQGSGR
ncbi:hypothetical protein OC845_001687 [Tilletia horrida]|nr:hypothetical protein OC845_001687 [Tilletia horrida]